MAERGRATRAVRAGMPHARGEGLTPPIHTATAEIAAGPPDPGTGWHYARYDQPGLTPFETALADLDGAADAVSFTAGMAAANALLEEVPAGGKLVIGDDGYFTIRQVAELDLPRLGIEVVVVAPSDLAAVGAALPGASLLWVETPSNPLLNVHDLTALDALCREHGVPWVLDATTPTPALLRPIEHGALAAMHAATKGISGHSDVLLGAISCAEQELADRLRARRTRRGSTPAGFSTWLARRGMQTLELRMARICETSLVLGEHLDAHPRVTTVHHPGLASHPDHATATRLMPRGVGGLFAFSLDGGAETADAVIDSLELWSPATSFGGVESTLERRSRWDPHSAPPGLIRCWAGLEDPEDLWADLEQALAGVS